MKGTRLKYFPKYVHWSILKSLFMKKSTNSNFQLEEMAFIQFNAKEIVRSQFKILKYGNIM